MSGKELPAGIPADAREVSISELERLAQSDPEIAKLLNKVKSGSAQGNSKDKQGRYSVVIGGREIYKWSQTLDEVTLFIQKPPGVPNNAFFTTMKADHLILGIKGNDRNYIDETTGGVVDEDESFMTIEDDTIVIYLQKAEVGKTWVAALKGHTGLNSADEDLIMRKMMLERFQKENPTFDFSNAEFTGDVPDVRNFMGG